MGVGVQIPPPTRPDLQEREEAGNPNRLPASAVLPRFPQTLCGRRLESRLESDRLPPVVEVPVDHAGIRGEPRFDFLQDLASLADRVVVVMDLDRL